MYKNILIIKMSSLGDVIHTLPSLFVLRKTYPNAKITWAVHSAFAEVLPGKPWIDEVYIIDRNKIKNLSYLNQVRKELHAHHFDLVIDFQMIAKSAIISFLSGGKKHIGYWDAREGSWLVNQPIKGLHKTGHIIEQLLDVTRYLGCKVTSIEFPFADITKATKSATRKLQQAGLQGNYIVLVPGTRGESKKWPIDCWGELTNRLSNKGIYTVLLGTQEEIYLQEKILSITNSSFILPLMGQTSLLELVAIEKMAKVHVSSDTGPLHIANAMKTSMVALFGPTLPKRSGPYGNLLYTVILADHAGEQNSDMNTISVDQVYEAVIKRYKEQIAYI